jgi:hypothetical protein
MALPFCLNVLMCNMLCIADHGATAPKGFDKDRSEVSDVLSPVLPPGTFTSCILTPHDSRRPFDSGFISCSPDLASGQPTMNVRLQEMFVSACGRQTVKIIGGQPATCRLQHSDDLNCDSGDIASPFS